MKRKHFIKESKLKDMIAKSVKSVMSKISNKKNSNNTEDGDDWNKAYWREHTKFYKPRGWDKHIRKGKFDFDDWWENG